MTLQPQMIVAVLVAMLAPIATKYGIGNDVLSSVIGAAVGFAAALYAAWQTSHSSLVKAVQASPTEQVVTISQVIKDAVPAVIKASPTAATVSVPVPRAPA